MEEIKKELKSIALDIVQQNSNNTEEWLQVTSKLYEKLLVLKYLEERDHHLDDIRKKVETQLGNIVSKPVEPNIEERTEEFIQELPDLSMQNEVRFVPHPEGPPVQKQSEIKESETTEKVAEKTETPQKSDTGKKQSIAEKAAMTKKKSLNESLSNQTIKFGLNDRIAFVKHLFHGSQEDFHRVVSQLNSFEALEDAVGFVNDIVKPEYNWKGKEEFEERFMTIVQSRFE